MTGVIAAGNPATAAAGAEMLRRGGNAVDAAVAAAFASFIAEIGLVHLGGSGLAQIFEPRSGRSMVYDFFSAMPGRNQTEPPPTLDFEKVTIDFGAATQDFYLGRASVAVPGNIFGLCQLADDYGRLPLPTLLEPYVRLSREGATLDQFQADTCELLRPLYTHTDSMRQIFTPNGAMVKSGDRLFIPNLTETLLALGQEGSALARTGRLAQAILADQQAHSGLLTASDLADYEVIRRQPIRIPYREFEVWLPPLSSSGGVLTAFSLKLLAHVTFVGLDHGSAGHLRLLYEVMAATSRARPVWERLLNELPAGEAIATFLADSFVEGYVTEMKEALHGRPSDSLAEKRGPSNTSHLSVIDGDGMAVSLTTTAGESAGYVVPNTGYIPNNMLGEEDLNPHGFHQWPAGQRIPTMMTPLFVTLNGKIRLVTGSGGSARIRSAILQTLVNLLDFKLKLDPAVNAPRVHLDNDLLQCEGGYDPTAVDELERLGYRVNRWQNRGIYFGGAHTVSRTPEGRLVPAGDTRRGGSIAIV